MPKLICDCGAERVFTVDEVRAAAGKPYQCPACGKVRKLPLQSAQAQQPPLVGPQQLQPQADNAIDDLLAEIEAADQLSPPRASNAARTPSTPLAVAVEREMTRWETTERQPQPAGSDMRLLAIWAIFVIVGCYLVSVAAFISGVLAFRNANSVMHEILALLCWLIALVALCGGCSMQVLLAICKSVNGKSFT